jgi:predicted component of type VI protein secretion system
MTTEDALRESQQDLECILNSKMTSKIVPKNRRALAQGVSDHGPLSFEQDTDTTAFWI